MSHIGYYQREADKLESYFVWDNITLVFFMEDTLLCGFVVVFIIFGFEKYLDLL